MAIKAEPVLDAKAIVGEGAIWNPKTSLLYWVDIEANELHIYNPADDTDKVHDIGQRVGTVVIRESGGVMLAIEQGFAAYDPGTQALTMIRDPEPDLPDNRFNDGKCDPAGRFWAGTMSISDASQPVGALYRLNADRSVTKMFDNVSCSNGIVWTSDRKTMYYIDSYTHKIEAFDYNNDTGDIANRRTVIEVTESDTIPDGMAIDAEDQLWVAMWGGASVNRYDPVAGKKIDAVLLPCKQITSCAFTGPNLDQMYITSARHSLNDEDLKTQPLAGALFKANTGVQGAPTFNYAG